MGSHIRDCAVAVHETAATLGFMLKKEQEKVIVAFTQGHDVFVALSTGLARASATVCRTFLTGFTNGSIAVLKTRLLTVYTSIVSPDPLSPCVSVWLVRLAPYSRGLS